MVTSVTPIFDELAQRLGLSWDDVVAPGEDVTEPAEAEPEAEVLETA